MAFKSGESGNPGGRAKLPPEIRTQRKEQQINLINLITKHFNMTPRESAKTARKEGTSSLEKAIKKIVYSASQNGSVSAFNYLIKIMVGKIPDTDYDEATEEELFLLQKVREALNKPDSSKELNG